MKKFYWSGLQQGCRVKGILHALSLDDAQNKLQQKQIKISYLYQEQIHHLKLPLKKQLVLLKQLSMLICANISILRSLEIIELASEDKIVQQIIQNTIHHLQQGKPLAVAFDYLDAFSLQMIKTGEKTGRLDLALETISEVIEKKWLNKQKLIKTLTYPMVLLLVSFFILVGLVTFVVPQFQIIFKEFNTPLPFITQLLMIISNLFIHHSCMLFTIGCLFIFVFSTLSKLNFFKTKLDIFVFKIPLFSYLKKQDLAFQFFLGSSLLFQAGISLTDSLLHVKNSITSRYAQHFIQQTIIAVQQGKTFHAALAQTNFFSSISTQLIQVAEETGRLEDILCYLTQYHQQQFDDALALLQQLLEPMVMIVLSILVGGLLLALYLPIFNLGSLF